MALDVTINLNDALEGELRLQTDEHNVVQPMNPLTPAQFLRRDVRDRLTLSAQQRSDRERLGFRAAYKLCTPEEQATIDAILAPHR